MRYRVKVIGYEGSHTIDFTDIHPLMEHLLWVVGQDVVVSIKIDMRLEEKGAEDHDSGKEVTGDKEGGSGRRD